MEHKVIAEKRTEVGKGPNNRLRQSGRIPAIVYGHDEPIPVSLEERSFMLAFKNISESTLVELGIGKDKRNVLVKDYQEDVLSGRVLHVDFFEVEAGKKLRTHVAIHLVGTPQEVREGALLETQLHEVEIECVPKDLPDTIDVPVEGLTSEKALHVSDIKVPAGVRVVTNGDAVVAAIVRSRAEVEASAADGDAAVVGSEETTE